MSDNVRGLLWALVAAALFSVVTALGKFAVQDYHVLQILFFRQVFVFLSSFPAIVAGFPQALRTRHPIWHGFRLIGAFVALSAGIWAVVYLPLTTAVTLGFAKVFFVALLAALVLGERAGPRRVIAIVAGFVGVLIVIRPGLHGFLDFHVLIPLGGAMGAAVAVIAVRRLSQTESTATLLIYQALFIGAVSGALMLWFWVTPDWAGLLLLAGMGVLSAMGQWVGVKALRLGEATALGNVEYTNLIYAAILGYLWFSEVPDGFTLTGAVVIVAAAVFLFHAESRAPQR